MLPEKINDFWLNIMKRPAAFQQQFITSQHTAPIRAGRFICLVSELNRYKTKFTPEYSGRRLKIECVLHTCMCIIIFSSSLKIFLSGKSNVSPYMRALIAFCLLPCRQALWIPFQYLQTMSIFERKCEVNKAGETITKNRARWRKANGQHLLVAFDIDAMNGGVDSS